MIYSQSVNSHAFDMVTITDTTGVVIQSEAGRGSHRNINLTRAGVYAPGHRIAPGFTVKYAFITQSTNRCCLSTDMRSIDSTTLFYITFYNNSTPEWVFNAGRNVCTASYCSIIKSPSVLTHVWADGGAMRFASCYSDKNYNMTGITYVDVPCTYTLYTEGYRCESRSREFTAQKTFPINVLMLLLSYCML